LAPDIGRGEVDARHVQVRAIRQLQLCPASKVLRACQEGIGGPRIPYQVEVIGACLKASSMTWLPPPTWFMALLMTRNVSVPLPACISL